MDMNRITLMGRLGKDPELKTTKTGKAVVRFSLATGSKVGDKETVQWHTIIAWERQAETCAEALSKGSKVLVEGRLEYRDWENKEGQKQRSAEVIAYQVYFLDPPKSAGQKTAKPEGGNAEPKADDFPF